MKEMKDINIKELKEVVTELNKSGLVSVKIKQVGVASKKILEDFTNALSELPEGADVPKSIADFYNDLYADEIVEEEVAGEEISDKEVEEEEVSDEEGGDEVTEDSEEGDEAEIPMVPIVKEKKKKTPPVVRSKEESKAKAKTGSIIEKRAEINPKLSLVKKVKNLLNFKDGRYKMTSYFPLDVEAIRVLEGNVGLYPAEVLAAILQDKKAVKKIEKYTDPVLHREINKIKSCYAYIVGAIREDRADGKLRNIMTLLLEGKEVPPEMGHYSTVKIARRALLAYMEVTGIDHSTMTKVKDEMVEKAATKPAPKAATKPAAEKADTKLKPASKANTKPAPAKTSGKSSKK